MRWLLRVRAFDGAGGVGGTWWYNRYPGARVDAPSSPFYAYTFSKELVDEWDWQVRLESRLVTKPVGKELGEREVSHRGALDLEPADPVEVDRVGNHPAAGSVGEPEDPSTGLDPLGDLLKRSRLALEPLKPIGIRRHVTG